MNLFIGYLYYRKSPELIFNLLQNTTWSSLNELATETFKAELLGERADYDFCKYYNNNTTTYCSLVGFRTFDMDVHFINDFYHVVTNWACADTFTTPHW